MRSWSDAGAVGAFRRLRARADAAAARQERPSPSRLATTCRRAAILASSLLASAASSLAGADGAGVGPDPTSSAGNPIGRQFAEDHLLGDWGGARTALWEAGLEPLVLLVTDPYGNPVGGREEGFATYSMLCADLGVDTGRLFGHPGGRFDVGFAANFGTQLSQDYVGNVFPIQSSDVAPQGTRMTNLSFTQSFLGEKASVRAGRFSLDALYGEEFAGSEYFRAFTSVAFNAVPFALFYNAPGPFGYPATTWGARLKVEPVDGLYLMGGIYDGNPDAALADSHGLDFSFEGPPLGIAELGLRFHQKEGDEGLPANLKFGGYALGGEVEEFGTTTDGSGRYGFYVVGDQMLVRFGSSSEGRSLGMFGSIVIAPDESVSAMPYFLNAGLVAHGPFEGRPKDFLALGVAYGAFSSDLRNAQRLEELVDPSVEPQYFEMAFELSYGFEVAPGMLLQPGVQVIVHPGGGLDAPTALAAGVNAVISF